MWSSRVQVGRNACRGARTGACGRGAPTIRAPAPPHQRICLRAHPLAPPPPHLERLVHVSVGLGARLKELQPGAQDSVRRRCPRHSMPLNDNRRKHDSGSAVVAAAAAAAATAHAAITAAAAAALQGSSHPSLASHAAPDLHLELVGQRLPPAVRHRPLALVHVALVSHQHLAGGAGRGGRGAWSPQSWCSRCLPTPLRVWWGSLAPALRQHPPAALRPCGQHLPTPPEMRPHSAAPPHWPLGTSTNRAAHHPFAARGASAAARPRPAP